MEAETLNLQRRHDTGIAHQASFVEDVHTALRRMEERNRGPTNHAVPAPVEYVQILQNEVSQHTWVMPRAV